MADEVLTIKGVAAVTELSIAFALAVPHDDAIRIRDDVSSFLAVRTAIAKSTAGDRKASGDLDLAIRQIVWKTVASDEVIDIFAAAGLKNPDISILSDQFRAEVRGMQDDNLAVELLREAGRRGDKLNLSSDELAYYDAHEVNDSAVKILGYPPDKQGAATNTVLQEAELLSVFWTKGARP